MDYMDTPLATWVQSFHPTKQVTYQELSDGAFLNDVMHEIDSRSMVSMVARKVDTPRDRIHNWNILMKNIKTYYEDVLQLMIVMKLPHHIKIAQEPVSEFSRKEMQKVLLLILGCAVQCEKREQIIESIQDLDINTQQAIVECIKEITEENKNVFSIDLQSDHDLPIVTQDIFRHLRSIVDERDGYVEEILELSQSLEDLLHQQQTTASLKTVELVQTSSPEKHHLAVELAECKSRLRKLRQDYEEKVELASELQEELDETKVSLNKLRTENLDLVQEARASRTYRDEMDILKERASRVDKYELEITKYREKLNELEFYKTRVEEIREDNAILVETKNMLEDQLSTSQKRLDAVIELENELLRTKQQLDDMSAKLKFLDMEKDQAREKIEMLAEENARLEFEKKSSFNESANLEEELMRARSQVSSGISNSISDQLNETANAKILRLELENQRLSKRMEELREKDFVENTNRVLELEKENNRLCLKVASLQEHSNKEAQMSIGVEQKNQDLIRETQDLKETIETIRESSNRQVLELEREKDLLEQQIDSLRERNEKSQDLRTREVEKENKRMHENVTNMSSQVSQLDYENRQLQKSLTQLQENVERVKQLEEENARLERHDEELHKQVATLKLTCDKIEKLEQESQDLEVENRKMLRMVTTLKNQVAKMEALEQDNINLTVEVQQLNRNLETSKNSSCRFEDLEQEKTDLELELELVKKTVETLRVEQAKQEQLEVDLLELDTDNTKLQRSLEAMTRRADELQNEVNDLEGSNNKLSKTVETMRLSLKKLEDLERDNRDLELDVTKQQKDKAQVEKENKRLKQTLEVRDSTLDELSSKLSVLQKENKSLHKSAAKSEDFQTRVHELEQECSELVQKAGIDKKTLATLREDLVNEKIRSQTLSNDLDKVSAELEQIGLNREKLAAAQQDESKYIALESMMNDAYKKSMDLKTDKIRALESRLEESKKRNLTLQSDLDQIKHNYEGLQQRREEEAASGRKTPSGRIQTYPNATQEILELQDRLITVERCNATLEAENKNFKEVTTSLQDRLKRAESQGNNMQSHLTTFNGLQSQLAKVQVENTTLQSQNAALVSQNTLLQRQHTQLEMRHEKLQSGQEDMMSTHTSLSADHDALQKLHEQLTAEYEALISEHGSLKANHKSLKSDLKDLQEQHGDLQREKAMLTELKRAIDEDRLNLKSETKSMGTLQIDMLHLREENIRLRSANEKRGSEYQDLLKEHKTMKTEYNQLKLRHTELQGNFADCRDQLNSLDIEISRMAARCEALSQLNTKLEEENRTLMMQLQALLTQNQEMLTKSLESKDHFHEEERAYLEKLSELRRQKEKLEEKIMEQYKRYDPVKKKNRSFGANLVRKARGFISRGNRSKERSKTVAIGESFSHDSGENSSLGSGSFANDHPDGEVSSSFLKKKKKRRGSMGNMLDDSPPQLNKQRSLAKSTTALNIMKDLDNQMTSFSIRGSKSTENLTLAKDSESVSSGHSEWTSRSGRRRPLLESSSSVGGVSLEEKTSPRSQAEDTNEEISLEQFLCESDKSPRSRRKFLLQKRIDPDSIYQDDLETTPDPPPGYLTPRPPTANDDVHFNGEGKRGLSSSKSEGMLNHVARPNSSTPRSKNFGNAVTTSTPKFQSQSNLRQYGERPAPQGEAAKPADRSLLFNQRLQRQGSADPYIDHVSKSFHLEDEGKLTKNRSHSTTDSPIYSEIPARSKSARYPRRFSENHALSLYEEQPGMGRGSRRYEDQPGRVSDGSNNPGINNHNPGINNPGINRFEDPSTRRNGLNESWQNGLYHPRQGSGSSGSSYNDYMHVENRRMNGSDSNQDGSRSMRGGGGDYDDPYLQGDRSSRDQDGLTTQYQPGNVRNLVQSYQKSVQQQSPTTKELPVPPPRRTRPMSTPPEPPAFGSSDSAFHTPRAQTPSYTTINIINQLPSSQNQMHNPNRGRSLPPRPDETPPREPTPHREPTPPIKPESGVRENPPGKKANAVWYEYGCV